MLAQQSCSAKSLQVRAYARATRLAVPINTLPKWHDLEDSLRNQKRKPPAEVFPWPDIPQPGFTQENMKDVSTKWLASKHNNGNGSRAINVQNFHWKVKNAYDLDSLLEFKGHIGRLDQGTWNILAIFRAPDGHDFCPGADLKKLYKKDLNYSREFFKACYETCYFAATMQTPAFFCMQGDTMGVGAGLTSHSVFRIATESAVWAMPNTLYGSFPDCGMSYVLPRLDGEVGMYLALSGKRVETTDIVRIGLATHFIPVEDISAFEQESGKVETDNINDLFTWLTSFLRPLPKESAIAPNLPKINEIFAHDTLVEIFEALEKEKTGWSRALLRRLNECSPLMLHVTFRLQRIGRYLNSLEDALELEYRIAQNMIAHSEDFYEGIRARIMEPGSVPKWKHKSIYDVTNEEIAQFFDPVEEKLSLKACKSAKRPEKDPYAIFVPQVACEVNSLFSTHLFDRHLNDVLPPESRTIEDMKKYFSLIMEDGGFDEIAAEYYYTKEQYDKLMIEEIDKEYLLSNNRDVKQLDYVDNYHYLQKNLNLERKGDLYLPEIQMPIHGKTNE